MIYEKNVKLKEIDIKRLQSLLDKEELDFEKEDIEPDSILFNEFFKFENGFMANIKVCSGQTNCWVEAVLFNEAGSEIGVTEPSFDILGEYNFQLDQDEFNITIEK